MSSYSTSFGMTVTQWSRSTTNTSLDSRSRGAEEPALPFRGRMRHVPSRQLEAKSKTFAEDKLQLPALPPAWSQPLSPSSNSMTRWRLGLVPVNPALSPKIRMASPTSHSSRSPSPTVPPKGKTDPLLRVIPLSEWLQERGLDPGRCARPPDSEAAGAEDSPVELFITGRALLAALRASIGPNGKIDRAFLESLRELASGGPLAAGNSSRASGAFLEGLRELAGFGPPGFAEGGDEALLIRRLILHDRLARRRIIDLIGRDRFRGLWRAGMDKKRGGQDVEDDEAARRRRKTQEDLYGADGLHGPGGGKRGSRDGNGAGGPMYDEFGNLLGADGKPIGGAGGAGGRLSTKERAEREARERAEADAAAREAAAQEAAARRAAEEEAARQAKLKNGLGDNSDDDNDGQLGSSADDDSETGHGRRKGEGDADSEDAEGRGKHGDGAGDEEIDLSKLPLFRIKTDPALENADDLDWAAGTLLPLLSPEALAMSAVDLDDRRLEPLDPSSLHEPLAGISPFGIRSLAEEFRAAIQAAWASIDVDRDRKSQQTSGFASTWPTSAGTGPALPAAGATASSTRTAPTARELDLGSPFQNTLVPLADDAEEERWEVGAAFDAFDSSEDGSPHSTLEEGFPARFESTSDSRFSESSQRLQRKRYRSRLHARTSGSISLSRSRQRWLDRMSTCKRSLAALDTFVDFGKSSSGALHLPAAAS